MEIKINVYKRFLLLVVFVTFLTLFKLYGQEKFPVITHFSLSLKVSKTSIVYYQDSIIFYLAKSELVNYLKKSLKTDSNSKDRLLLVRLQTSSHLTIKDNSLTFDRSTGNVDTTCLENYYQLSIKKVLPYMLPNGKTAVFNNVSKTFIKKVYFKESLTSDFLGLKYFISVTDFNGKIIYHKIIRDIAGETL